VPSIISLIPARGGSKGIYKKNIAPLAGKPLIAYSIEYSLACPLIGRTIVSTDDSEIADIAKKYGAEVPFLRPSELAQDDTQDYPVFLHALQWLREHEGYTPDLVVHLRPTSPLRPTGLIEKAIQMITQDPDADCLRTISETPITPYKMWKMEKGYLRPFVQLEGKESYNMPRQDLPKVFWHNSVLDIIRASTILEKHSVSGIKILPLLMDDSFLTVDIDKPFDLIVAEAALKMRQQKNSKGDQPCP
jgi:N-acylneuraminate cytidylyltransferase